ncbi:MAG TPA: prepilin peptidase [Candidatus Cloacimonetes bacterium]|nr:prepilin peptidase [Candidatus Cloacimonadota bacterium]HEX37840.1 prepilin peptidase [Candidatus Cloacimonadota bacterium]
MLLPNFIIAVIFALIAGKICNILILLFLNEDKEYGKISYPFCGASMKWYFFIPILHQLVTKNSCPICFKKFPYYFIINELLTPILVLALYVKFGFSFIFVHYTLLTILGVVVFYADLYKRIIPDILIYPMIIIALLFSFANLIGFQGALKGFILGAGFFVIIALIFKLFTRRQGLGGGDIKLIAVIGLSLGLRLTFLTILLSSILGVIIYSFSRARKEVLIPYGSFIVIAMYVSMIFGNELINWYLGLWGVV